MAKVVKKISMPRTLRAMKAGDMVNIPFMEIRPSTVYNAVIRENIKCGWEQWKLRLVKDGLDNDFYEIRRVNQGEEI